MDQADPLAYLLNFGALGVLLVLWLTGVIVTRRDLDRSEEGAQEWKALYQSEVEAHGRTRQALERERDRMDASLEASRTASAILSALGHRPLPLDGGGT